METCCRLEQEFIRTTGGGSRGILSQDVIDWRNRLLDEGKCFYFTDITGYGYCGFLIKKGRDYVGYYGNSSQPTTVFRAEGLGFHPRNCKVVWFDSLELERFKTILKLKGEDVEWLSTVIESIT